MKFIKKVGEGSDSSLSRDWTEEILTSGSKGAGSLSESWSAEFLKDHQKPHEKWGQEFARQQQQKQGELPVTLWIRWVFSQMTDFLTLVSRFIINHVSVITISSTYYIGSASEFFKVQKF